MKPACQIFRSTASAEHLAGFVRALLPDGAFRRICIKPNWVMHAEHPAFPIEALVTSPALIEAVVTACLEKYPDAEWISVCDVPLQSCEWEKLSAQSGLDAVRRKFEGRRGPAVRFLDLRRERFIRREGFLVPDPAPQDGDPLGYREVILDEESQLDAISGEQACFRVSDYDPGITRSNHRRGHHRYLVAGTVLAADLFINLPKMKTHQKAGLTGALKNLVGINGQKACLVHHRKNIDEFSHATPWLVRFQVRVRELLQKRSHRLFILARKVWLVLKKARGIQTEVTREHLHGGKAYIAAGSWHGNDTLWRMIYDINLIIRRAPPAGGRLRPGPQRAYLAIVDGIVAGEGNGPLQSLPVPAGLVWAAEDPFVADLVMARLMGFDDGKIPTLSHRQEFPDPAWGHFAGDELSIQCDGADLKGLDALAPARAFAPPPGWKGHIERAEPPP